ncbi:MAG: rRNA pseudouridine synthase [Deltaproteobacteria bacterium]|nr:rRNA pseudouridine synthase [Deltaproteobacteria bacterium]
MNPSQVRINKALALAGLASRRGAEKLVLGGRVRLNGAVVRDLGITVRLGEDRLEVDGRSVAVQANPAREVWALYKPKNCVSTLDDPEGRPTLRDFFPRSTSRLFPIGRLDYDAEGLILLTNDGDLAQQVAHPSHSMTKVYLVKVKGVVAPEAVGVLAQGPVLDGKQRRGIRARVLHVVNDKTWLEVTLREGIQHHIKKAFAAVDHRVLKIKRFQVGSVTLEELRPGQSRRLSREEVEHLLSAAQKG